VGIEKKAGGQAQKEIIILSDLSEKKVEIIRVIINIFFKHNIRVFFYQKEVGNFFEADREIIDLNNEFIFTDCVINLMNVDSSFSKSISQKVKDLGIKVIQNSIDKRIVFSSRFLSKSIFKKYNYKTPVFEILKNKNFREVFNNFVQPSRIFSFKNNFSSEKIDSTRGAEKNLLNLDFNKEKYFIEEYIDGENFFSLVYKKDGEVFCYTSKTEKTFSIEERREVVDISKDFFQNIGLDKFCLIKFKKNKKRGLFFLDVFADLDIFTGNKGEVVKNILQKEGIGIKNILEF
jgi:hypothetical protein